MTDASPDRAVLLQAEQLSFGHPGVTLLDRLSFSIRPGLTLVRGGDGRGKTSLLRLMAGVLLPGAGVIHRHADTLFHEEMADKAHGPVVARAWLEARRPRFAQWDPAAAGRLIDGFGLAEHIDKPLYMLSTGSRRKVGLVAAAASGARLTLLDTPFAALDAGSRGVVTDLLVQAATGEQRAWVVADYELPEGLAGVQLAGFIDLGD